MKREHCQTWSFTGLTEYLGPSATSDFNCNNSTGKFVSDLLHFGSAECRSQDAPHSLPAFIPQHEQTVAHGLGDEAQTLHKEQADKRHPFELNQQNLC